MDERYSFSKKGSIIACTVSLDPIGGSEKLSACYARAAAAFLGWLENERLPALCEASAAERGRRRLHRAPEQWRFSLTARPNGKYLSVTLTVTGVGEGFERRFTERRVWLPETGILVPLTTFLPARKAKQYEKWAYSLEDDCIQVYRKGKMHKITRDKTEIPVKT